MMKILILAARYPPEIIGGGEISTQLIAEALADSGVDVVVVCGRRNNTEGEERINGVRVRSVPIANLYHYPPAQPTSRIAKLAWHLIDRNNPQMRWRVAKILHEEAPDILHSHTLDGFSSSIWRAGRDVRIPVIHTLRSYYLLCANSGMRKNGRNCEAQCRSCKMITNPKRVHSNQIQGVIGISQFILNQHTAAGYFQNARKRVIFNPIPAWNPPRQTDIAQSSPSINGSLPTTLRLGFLGRINEMKGIEPTLNQLRDLPANSYRFRIAGTGDPNYISHLQSCAQGLPVKFCGQVTSSEFLSSLDLLIVPSAWNEPFGRVTVEAFACGVPVIATATGGTKELIDEGVTGFFFDPAVPGNLAAIINRIRSNFPLLESMRNSALKKSTQFAQTLIGREHFRFYEDLLQSQNNQSAHLARYQN